MTLATLVQAGCIGGIVADLAESTFQNAKDAVQSLGQGLAFGVIAEQTGQHQACWRHTSVAYMTISRAMTRRLMSLSDELEIALEFSRDLQDHRMAT